MRQLWPWIAMAALVACAGAAGGAAAGTPAAERLSGPFPPATGDTLRTNYRVAETLLGEAVDGLLADLPPPPAHALLVPATTEPGANLLTEVMTARLLAAGYQVHLDRAPPGTEDPVIELRYRVGRLELSYPRTGRRLGIWKSWFSRQMTFVAQVTAVDRLDGQVLLSRRLTGSYQDRVPHGYQAAIEAREYPFTQAVPQSSGWSRRLEEMVVLGALAGMVAIYFANTE